MNKTERAKEYATALFMVALEAQKKKAYAAALETVVNSLRDNPEYVEFLCAPNIPRSERISSIDEIFSASIPEDVVSFVKLLCENRCAKHLSRIISEFLLLTREAENRTRATVYYVEPLSDEQKAALVEKLMKVSGKTVEAEYVEDKSLIGGIKVVLDDKLLDGSVSGRLSKIKGVIGK